MTLAKKLSAAIKGKEAPKEKRKLVVIQNQPEPEGGEDLQQSPPPSLINIIESVHDSSKIHYNYFRPSMVFGCARANVFHYTHQPSHPSQQDNRLLRILDNGTAIHSVIQGYISNHPDIWFAPESKVLATIGGALVRGSCDGVLIRREDNYRWGLEFKTMADKSFAKLTRPMERHVLQACLYAKMQRLYWVTILYWNKNTQHLKEFHIKYQPERWKEMKARIKELKGYVDRGEVPEYDKSTCDTAFCRTVEHCRSLGAPV